MTTAEASPATTEIQERIARIAARRREITRLLNELGQQVQAAEVECAADCDALQTLVRVDRTGARARMVAEGLEAERVDTGCLSSRLVDALDAHGLRTFPPQYAVELPRWALVTNR